jgi:tRNA dimethylallyltransferase
MLPSDLIPLFLVGPTAVGKSVVALSLAKKLDGEIVAVDSMQAYRGLDIGTAKPSLAERNAVPHHLIDVVDLTETFDAGRFVLLACHAVEAIKSRRRVPIFCGGTGLYFKAYIEGLGTTPPPNPTLRAELEATPLPDLLRELERCDPVTFRQIDCRNVRRVVRALEVIRQTGKPFSEQRAPWRRATVNYDLPPLAPLFGLARDTTDLHARIDARVDAMFREGLVEETRRLLACGLAENRAAMQALGYRQVVAHLRGECPLAETIALVKARTRQYAKRQMTWFRRQLPVTWTMLAPSDSLEAVAEQLAEQYTTWNPNLPRRLNPGLDIST